MNDNLFKFLGRVFIGAFFLWFFSDMAMNPSPVMAKIRSFGLPYPGVFYALFLVAFGVGTLGVLLGYKTRPAALLLIAGWVLFVVVAHFDLSSKGKIAVLLNDLAVTGGLLYIAATGPGLFHLRG